MTSERLAVRTAEVARDKLGEDIVIIDLRGRSSLADFFVVATAGSTIHAQAIASEVVSRLKQEGEPIHHSEGTEAGVWVLLDYVDVVVHILTGETRQYYGFERLWGDAPHKDLPSERSVP